MEFFNYALIFCASLLLTSCGGERDTSINTSSKSSSNSSISSKSNSSLSSASSIATKTFKMSFDDAGCMTDHNADATTEFDAFGGKRKMLSWNCVIDPISKMTTEIDLVYVYDTNTGCYKKDTNEKLIYGALSLSESADCNGLAQSVLKPEYSVQIEQFDVQQYFENDVTGSISFEYALKNTGNLPLSQWRTVLKVWLADGSGKGSYFSEEAVDYKAYLLPGAVIDTAKDGNTAKFGNLAVNQLYNVELSIQDFYGHVLSVSQTQIRVIDKPQ